MRYNLFTGLLHYGGAIGLPPLQWRISRLMQQTGSVHSRPTGVIGWEATNWLVHTLTESLGPKFIGEKMQGFALHPRVWSVVSVVPKADDQFNFKFPQVHWPFGFVAISSTMNVILLVGAWNRFRRLGSSFWISVFGFLLGWCFATHCKGWSKAVFLLELQSLSGILKSVYFWGRCHLPNPC